MPFMQGNDCSLCAFKVRICRSALVVARIKSNRGNYVVRVVSKHIDLIY